MDPPTAATGFVSRLSLRSYGSLLSGADLPRLELVTSGSLSERGYFDGFDRSCHLLGWS